VVAATGCLPATLPESAVPGRPSSDPAGADGAELVPGGFGTLRQEEITLSLRAEDMQIKVTPLAPEVVRLAAPDTWRRLAGVRRRLSPRLPSGHELFLVSFFTEAAGGAEMDPRDVVLVDRGRRFRPVEIAPLSEGWGAGRVQPRRPEQAVYAFAPAVDPLVEFAVEVGGRIHRGWAAVLPRLEAERARVRARAAGGGAGTAAEAASPGTRRARGPEGTAPRGRGVARPHPTSSTAF
jgi:hypothetical protein